MENGFFLFIILVSGIGLLCYHCIRVAQAIADTTGNDAYLMHGMFALFCVPFAFEFLWSQMYSSAFSINEFVGVLALLGWGTLYAVIFEIIVRKLPKADEGLIAVCFITPIAIFDIWRLYDLIWLREHFWILLFPLAGVAGIAVSIIQSNNTQQASPPQQQWQSPMASPPPKPKLVIDHDDDHPIKPDPASVFEKRR